MKKMNEADSFNTSIDLKHSVFGPTGNCWTGSPSLNPRLGSEGAYG